MQACCTGVGGINLGAGITQLVAQVVDLSVDGINIDALKQLLYEKAKLIHTQRFPYNDFLFQRYDDLEG